MTSFFTSKKSCDNNFNRKSPETIFMDSTFSSDEELSNFTQTVLENLGVLEKDGSREEPATNSRPKIEIILGKPYICPSPSTPRKTLKNYTPSPRKPIAKKKRINRNGPGIPKGNAPPGKPPEIILIDSTVSSDEEMSNFTQIVLENLAVLEDDASRERPVTNATPKMEITPGKPYISPSPSSVSSDEELSNIVELFENEGSREQPAIKSMPKMNISPGKVYTSPLPSTVSSDEELSNITNIVLENVDVFENKGSREQPAINSMPKMEITPGKAYVSPWPSTVSSDEELSNFTQIVLEDLTVFEDDGSREQPATDLMPKKEITPGRPYISPSPTTPNKKSHNYTTYTPSSRKDITRKNRIDKVKMNVNQKFGNTPPSISDDFRRACQQQDDVTTFLLQIIQDYTHDKSMHHLLGEKQHDLVVNFLKLKNSDSIKMLSKMYWLQWKWRREETLAAEYSTINQENTSKDGLQILCEEGYLEQGTKLMTLDEWLAILSKPQLITVCKEFKIGCRNANKEKLAKTLHAYCSKKSNTLQHFFNQNTKLRADHNLILNRVLRKITSVVGECYKISADAKSAFERLHMHVL